MRQNSSLALALACGLAACGVVGGPPEMTSIGATAPDAKPILTADRAAIAVPPPQPAEFAYQQGSLWSTGPTGLLGDRRARNLGDLLTVAIEIDDEAEIQNTTDRSRSGSEGAALNAAFGISSILPTSVQAKMSPNLDLSANSNFKGDGSVKRNEKIELRVAATVVQVLPNGQLVIQGDQEVRVNNELRDLQVTGIVRPEDISRHNEIPYDRIAGARISYGGRGLISSAQEPRYGQQITDSIMPY